MATSGTLKTSAYKGTHGNRYLELTWERTAIDIAAQTSTISWTLTGRGTYTGYMAVGCNVVIDGDTEFDNHDSRVRVYPGTVVATGTKVIKHNTDGTKSFAISVSAAIYYSSINATGSDTFTLDLVGMASITNAPNFNDVENPIIEYYNPVGSAITSLQAAISLTGEKPDIAYRDIPIASGSYTFTLTDDERNVLRAATTGSNTRKVRFYLRNIVNGELLFSWKEVSYTVINANPTITAGVVDTNANTIALTGDETTLIRYHSTAFAAMEATAYKQATITGTRIEHNGNTTTGTTYAINNVEGNIFAFIATDSRGNTVEKAIVAPMIDYIKPTANIDTTSQMDTTGTYTLKLDGNCYNDTFGYTSAAVANITRTFYRIKTQGGSYSAWRSMSLTLDGNMYHSEATLTGLDYRTTYIIQCKAQDKLEIAYSAEFTLKSLPVFHWGENDFVFEVPVQFNAGATGISGGGESSIVDGVYDGDLQITGDLWLKGSGNYGNSIYFGDKSYCYMGEQTDDSLTIKATTINLNGTVKVNGESISGGGSSNATSGTWTPTLSTSAAVSSYAIQQGWYQKIDNVITIGWYIKALIIDGYEDTTVYISGCPFTPAYNAFGGGVAHNIAFSSGFNFEGWAISVDGVIGVRGQPCNGTSKQNLNITSIGTYPIGGGTMTLAGTISFMTN